MNQSPSIIILDDDLEYGQLLTDIIGSLGKQSMHEVSASRFLEADYARSGVLILDLVMPEMDGIEVIREIAKRHYQYSLILISGFDERVLHSAEQLAQAHDLKVLASFTKPIRLNEFSDVIESLEIGQPEKTIHSAARSIDVDELRVAIQRHELVLHYQPQINLKTGKAHGMEALVRWQHPEHGLIYPDSFISLAEKENLIELLTHEVIEIACRDIAEHREETEGLVVSINVSSANITSLTLPEQLEALTEQYGIAPSQINIELTESAVLEQLTSSLDVLNRLRMKGFALSIDDFGTGYSSLSQLYRAPFSELKIDRQFTMRMLTDREALVIVKICIMLGDMLGMRVVAEGVETEEICRELADLGCDFAQGYGIAKPKPLVDCLSDLILRA